MGLSEKTIGQTLSSFYLERKVATALDNKDLLEIKIKSRDKDDIKARERDEYTVDNGKSIALKRWVLLR